MGNITEVNIKNPPYYFFDNMNNIKNFDPNLLKIDKKSYKNIDIYYIGYIIVKDSEYVNINSVNPLYLNIKKVEEYVEEINGNKYLTLVFTDKNKDVLTKYTELWDGIKNSIEKINNKLGEYGKDIMKIKFDLDDSLPLNKTLKLYNMTIIVRSVFEEDGKCYPQVFLDECLYEL